MPKNFFITGTDTDVGKTYVAAELVKAFQAGQIKASV
jgi:Dethiobiotin synthetase